MMNVPTYPLFFFEVDKEREEKAAFEALIGESVQWVYFKMVLAAFLVYLVSFFSLFVPGYVLGYVFHARARYYGPMICKAAIAAMIVLVVLGEIHYRFLASPVRMERVLRKSPWYLGENEKTMLLINPYNFDFRDGEFWPDPTDSLLRDEEKFYERIEAIQWKAETNSEVSAAYRFLEEKSPKRIGVMKSLSKIARMELCLKQYDIGNKDFLEKGEFQYYRNIRR